MMNTRGLNIPFISFGAVTSEDLFCDKEQVLFDFYERNAGRYVTALDVGANIGVHSILMARNRWYVRAIEPDPEHLQRLHENLRDNGVVGVVIYHAALSDHDGVERFTRVLGNTTGNHLKGDKQPYGELEEIEVRVMDCRPHFDWADFAKIDCEGHEARLLLTTNADTWSHMDAMVEVGNEANAWEIYRHLRGMVPMFSQKRDWRQVEVLEHVPVHHSEGALFIGHREPFK